MLNQISVYAENQRGTMKKITEILARENINILGSVTNDSAEYGIVRMVVSDPEKAATAFKDAGFLCKMIKVIGVEITDEAGQLDKLLSALYDSYINIDYMYLSFNRLSGKPIIILHTDDIYEVEDCIKAKGFQVSE